MTKICNFPISEKKRCTQPIANDKPNCGRHKIDLSADQLGQKPTIYEKDDELHIWASEPDDVYCLIHGDPAYQVLCQIAGEKPPSCLKKTIRRKDKYGNLHRDDGPAVMKPDGELEWYQHGQLHRDDSPARIYSYGTQAWYQHGKRHRDDGPAVIDPDGTQEWYRHGRRHREDGPAVIEADGTQEWWINGRRHRKDDPAVIRADGAQMWWYNGQPHRADGPAATYPDGSQLWYWRGKRHRDDGPAIVLPNTAQYLEWHEVDGWGWIDIDDAAIPRKRWYWHGDEVTKKEHERIRAAYN